MKAACVTGKILSMGSLGIRTKFKRYLVACALVATFLAGDVLAQEPAPDAEPIDAPATAVADEAAPASDAATPGLPTPAEMTALIRRVEESDTISAEVKGVVLRLYDQALDAIRQLQAHQERLAQLHATTEAAEAQSQELQDQLARPAAQPELDLPATLSLAEVKAAITETEKALAASQQRLTELQAEAQQRPQRRQQLPQLISDAQARLDALGPTGAVAPIEGEAPQALEARQLLHRAQRQAVESELQALEAELASYELRGNLGLLNQRIDMARREAEQAQALLQRYAAIENQLQRAETEDIQQRLQEMRVTVEEELPELSPFVQDLLQRYTAYERQLAGPEGLRTKITQAEAALAATLAEREKVSGIDTEIRERLELAGMTEAMAYLLHQQQGRLPNAAARRQDLERRQEELDALQWELFDMRDARAELPDVGDVEEIVATVAPDAPETQRDIIGEMLREAVVELRRKFDELQGEYDEYGLQLANLNTAEAGLIAATEELREFIDARILWVQSAPALTGRTFVEALTPLQWLITPRHWYEPMGDLVGYAQENRLLAAALITLVLLAFVVQPAARRQLQVLGKEAAKTSNTRISDTLRALIVTMAVATPVPGLLMATGWLFGQANETASLGYAIGQGLLLSGAVLLTLEVPRQTLRAGGLGEAHYNWPAMPQRRLRMQLLQLEFFAVPLLFLLGFVEGRDNDVWDRSLGRLTFMLAMILLSWIFTLNMRKGRGPIRQIIEQETTNARWPRVLVVSALVVPLVLLVMSGIGYHYTAVRLGWKLYITLCVMIGLVLVRGVVLRWLLLARRRLAMEQARKRREALKTAREGGAEAEIVPDDSPLDLSTVNIQSSRMLRASLVFGSVVALWFIWAEVLPALNFLEEKQIATIAGEDGEAVAITWLDVFMACLILLLAIAATRNIPGLLEISVLQRTGLAAGERYAITTVVRYTIMVLGGVLAFNSLNIGWGKLQWLVAALGLGLGFGLQEIFANFVSGLIILFERPIRVGDIVTIGDVSGSVSRIRMRATTVTDFDRKELIVPNKEFVTGKLINWSLSDTILRVVIPIGIAYGSDTDKAVQILREVAAGHPDVLNEPAPIILFDEFGESTLNFELRVYCSGIEHYLPLKHDMHMQVDKAFRNADIEIAFPQRDLHIRTVGEAVRVRQEGASTEILDVQPVK